MFLEMKVFGMTIDPFTNAPIVILKDLKDENALPIWIGLLEASAIASELENIKLTRPMTHDLLQKVLTNLDAQVEKIEVNDLRNNVFYATIHIDDANSNHFEIDARPSDAIAVALRTGSPIFVDRKVLEKSKKIDMRALTNKGAGESEKWQKLLETLNPEDFGKYKM